MCDRGRRAPPETAEVVASFGDARLKFVNLPYRGPYPDRKEDAWLISGFNPFNTAMRLAQGRWWARARTTMRCCPAPSSRC